MGTKDPHHAYVYTCVRNPVPDNKLTSRTERLRVGLPRFISVTYNGEHRVWGARFERATQGSEMEILNLEQMETTRSELTSELNLSNTKIESCLKLFALADSLFEFTGFFLFVESSWFITVIYHLIVTTSGEYLPIMYELGDSKLCFIRGSLWEL
jgi:hypothetical protein